MDNGSFWADVLSRQKEIKMTNQEAIDKLNKIAEENQDDCEVLHIKADEVLLAMVPEEVAVAYDTLRERQGFWYA